MQDVIAIPLSLQSSRGEDEFDAVTSTRNRLTLDYVLRWTSNISVRTGGMSNSGGQARHVL